MTINLTEIYKGLEAYRQERGLTAGNQKSGYIVNVMEEFGELAEALRDYEKIKKGEKATKKGVFEIKSTIGEIIAFENNVRGELEVTLKQAEHAIIDALCDIAVFTINAWKDDDLKEINTIAANWNYLLGNCAEFNEAYREKDFQNVLTTCATLAYNYGFNFEIAMLETIKEISSRTGSYDEVTKKWIKDEGVEARLKWYDADYEKARLEK